MGSSEADVEAFRKDSNVKKENNLPNILYLVMTKLLINSIFE